MIDALLRMFKTKFFQQAMQDPSGFEKSLNKFFLPIIIITPIIIFFLNFPEEKENHSIYREKPNFNITEAISPIPSKVIIDLRKAEIGEYLFSSTLLSKSNDLSCSTCHSISSGGTIRKQNENTLNPPTVFNAGLLHSLNDFHAGDSEDLFYKDLVHFPDEMGSLNERINSLQKDSFLKNKVSEIYKSSISESIIVDLLKEYIFSLYTPNSKFDQYLKGNKSILEDDEKQGYVLFKELGCITCHQGVNLGGNLYQKIDPTGYFFKDKIPTKIDLGKFLKTNLEEDKYKFKVPTLRNISITSPYLHDGSIYSLNDVVQYMAKYQLGKNLSDEDTTKIVKFLKTLTGEYKGKILQ